MSTKEMKEAIAKKTEELSAIQLQLVLEFIEKVNEEPIKLIEGENVERFLSKHASLLKRLAE